MRFSDLKKRILTLMDTEKRIQRFSKIIIAEFRAKSVHENKWFCEHSTLIILCKEITLLQTRYSATKNYYIKHHLLLTFRNLAG